MYTVTFVLLSTSALPRENITVTVPYVPRSGEFVMFSGQMYKVQEVTHYISDGAIEVRCVA